jgi:hypothetical protein
VEVNEGNQFESNFASDVTVLIAKHAGVSFGTVCSVNVFQCKLL